MDNYSGHPVWRYALKLIALLFVRTAELLQAPWSEFDLDNARWVISAERMKMDKPHIVPLPRKAIAILRELKDLAGDRRFVFPGLNKQTANTTINCNTLLNVLEEIGYKGVMTGHGFRGLARTILAEHGFDKAHVELQLAHANDDKTEAAYNHALYLPQRTELMQWWADYLDTELNKGMTKVVAIRKTA
jgi:integrase